MRVFFGKLGFDARGVYKIDSENLYMRDLSPKAQSPYEMIVGKPFHDKL